MASPFTFFIAASTGIELEIHHDRSFASNLGSLCSSMDPNDIVQGFSYKLTKMTQFDLKDGSDISKISMGLMSPTSQITLPPIRRMKAGIHSKATKYAYLHPPEGLANDIQWSEYTQDTNLALYVGDSEYFDDNPEGDTPIPSVADSKQFDLNQTEFSWAIPLFAVLGAFVYLDDDLKVLAVNVITLRKTKFALNMTGPFQTPDTLVRAMNDSKRVDLCPLDAFHENSFVASGWVRPNETFGGLGPSENGRNRHGSFIFVRYDGTAVTYEVSGNLGTQYSGESSIIPDIFASKACNVNSYAEMSFATTYFTDQKVREWRTFITNNCKDKQSGSLRSVTRPPPELEEEKSLIHEACRAGVLLVHIKMLLDEKEEVRSLSKQGEIHCFVALLTFKYRPTSFLHKNIKDRFGWNPLHYACAFSANNYELMDFLIEKDRTIVHQKDPYGRYPLHIACDSASVSLDVIQLLLEHGKSIVFEATKYLKVSLNKNTALIIESNTVIQLPNFLKRTAYSVAHCS